jgi:hypothetical protein
VPILTTVKLLALAAVLMWLNMALSDLAYAGMLYHLLLSGIAHIGVRKPSAAAPAAVGLVLLVASFMTQNAAREMPSPLAMRIRSWRRWIGWSRPAAVSTSS